MNEFWWYIFLTHIQKHPSPSNIVINALWHNVFLRFSLSLQHFISFPLCQRVCVCVLLLRKSNNPDCNLTCAYTSITYRHTKIQLNSCLFRFFFILCVCSTFLSWHSMLCFFYPVIIPMLSPIRSSHSLTAAWYCAKRK